MEIIFNMEDDDCKNLIKNKYYDRNFCATKTLSREKSIL